VEAFLRPRGLELSEGKTRITHVEKGFDFLGQRVRKMRGTLIVEPSRGSVRALMTKCKGLIKTQGGGNAELTLKLNPVLRGWANYHRHIYANSTFAHVDQRIFGLVWSWLKRQQRAKGKRWRAHNNFTRHRGRNWTLTGMYQTAKGATKTAYLLRMATLRNVPYAKIQAAAQPFDRKWDEYFAKRRNSKYLSISERRLKLTPTPCGI
jgi:RNA-directed DNA polymerase